MKCSEELESHRLARRYGPLRAIRYEWLQSAAFRRALSVIRPCKIRRSKLTSGVLWKETMSPCLRASYSPYSTSLAERYMLKSRSFHSCCPRPLTGYEHLIVTLCGHERTVAGYRS
ncbi:hypothetical protein PsYK624_170180 [Phanerochaete sordida]|uniref:Uncharacterized protein n=1 Tax=Phanerochaete sordida TaxID=48140 RepID=A0A9P3LNY5_9APHY|nr:hypothetical protein PsYK624_170180 [Phanerochaete sordida]